MESIEKVSVFLDDSLCNDDAEGITEKIDKASSWKSLSQVK
jgi:hypothetical protein